MSFSAANPRYTAPLIGPHSKYSIGSELIITSAPASAAWPTALRAYHIPLYLPRADTLYKFWVWNGATALATIDLALYRMSDLSRVVSSGPIAQSGTSVIQNFEATDTRVEPGSYYMTCILSATTGTVFRVQHGGGPTLASAGVAIWDTIGTLGATATLSTVSGASSFVPLFGVAFRTLAG